jgi:lipopolysaccharide/colanic/teichoic acid biosynthesis glycosyltransferase
MILGKPNRYDFVVTGASGNIGRYLVPMLADQGYRVLALGRDPIKLRRIYGNLTKVDCADYQVLPEQAECETLIHLAIRNNNQPGSTGDFTRDNVSLSILVCEIFKRLSGNRFINFSSIHSLEEGIESSYSLSKDLGLRHMESVLGDRLDNVYIGYFYSPSFFGEKLSFLEKAGGYGKMFFKLFKLLKPTTSIKAIGDYVLSPSGTFPHPRILTDDLSRSRAYRRSVRALDFSAALAILILLLPVFAILWLIIHLDSPGPAVFAQTRVGKGRVPFTLYKFRTMKRDTVVAGTHEVSVSAVTKAGKFLRKTKLDELPQAFNLLRGEMTLVGPRPCLPMQEELIRARSALGVYALKPGVTGYAQIRQIDMSRPQELAKSDYTYMKLQSFMLNFKILLLTAFGRGGGDRVDSRKAL